MAFDKEWSEADLGSENASDIDDFIENTRYGTRERLAVEHYAYADETGYSDVGRHKKAASRTNYGLAANKPSTVATGMVDGARYLETDTGLIKYYDEANATWVTEAADRHSGITTTYTTGTVDVTQDSATVTGNSTDFTSNLTTASVFLGPDSEYYGITSIDSSTQLTLDRTYDGSTASGQSYTAYLDGHPQYLPKSGGTVNGDMTVDGTTTMTGGGTLGANLAAGDNKITGLAAATENGDAVRYEQIGFGAWDSKSDDTAYEATTDGFVCATGGDNDGGDVNLYGYTDGSNPPTTLRVYCGESGMARTGITMPVRKGDYWKVTGATTVYWLPMGA